MSEILQQLEKYKKQLGDMRFPVAAVVRPDIYDKLHSAFFTVPSENQLLKRIDGLKVIPDPAASSIAMAQTEECILFYDNQSLTLYLNRGNKPLAWVRHCCELAGIPYPVEEDPGRQMKPEGDGQ